MARARPSSSGEGGTRENHGMRTAPWSAPLPRDVLGIESLGEEQKVAALGVSIALTVLLKVDTEPGWLPATIDEQRVPLNGLMAPMPSFCFTKDYRGVLPIRVVSSVPITPTHAHLLRSINARAPPPPPPPPHRNTADAPVRITPRRAPPNDRRGAGHGIRLRRACGEHSSDGAAGELGSPHAAGRVHHRVQVVTGR
jgi:hypothetical protein